MLYSPSTGLWLPPTVGPLSIPPSPPAEQRQKRRREWERQTRPFLAPGLAPAAWRQWADGHVDQYHDYPQRHPAQNEPGAFVPVVNALASLTDAVVYWKLSDTSDATGRGHTLTNNSSVSFSNAGILGNCATFDTTNWLDIADATDFDLSATQFTINLWFYIVSNSVYGLLYKGGITGPVTDQDYRIDYNAGILAFNGHVGSQDQLAYGSVPTNATWHMVTYGYRTTPSNQQFGRYDNGTESTSAATAPQHTTGRLSLGQRNIAGNKVPLNGRLDSVGMWLRQLNSTEIGLLYNAGAGADPF